MAGVAAGACGLLAVAGCTVGPDYEKPDPPPVPVAYKEAWKSAPTEKGWRPARPADAIDRGAWWSIFHDPVLDSLEREIDISNQNLKAAEAAFREAEATVAAARAQFFPTAAIDGSAPRSRGSGLGGGGVVTSSGSVVGGGGSGGGRISNQFTITATASWVARICGDRPARAAGRGRNVANAQASAATLANVRLSAQGTLATAYVELRTADELARLLSQSVKAFAEALKIVTNQYRNGTTDSSAVDQARGPARRDARAADRGAGDVRGQLEHSDRGADWLAMPAKADHRADQRGAHGAAGAGGIALGLARAAARHRRRRARHGLRQRPDRRRCRGVLSDRYAVSRLRHLGVDAAPAALPRRAASSRSAASAAETIFDGGARNAQLERDKAAYDGVIATYRQTVLSAFQQVEDQLLAQRVLADQEVAQNSAVKAARAAEATINNQYLAGTQAYTAVLVAENTALGRCGERFLNVRQSRLVAAVALIEARSAAAGTPRRSRRPTRSRATCRSISTRCRRSSRRGNKARTRPTTSARRHRRRGR